MKRIFSVSIFMLVLFTILFSSPDFSFAQEEHSFITHDDEIENTSNAVPVEEEHQSSNEIESSMKEIQNHSEHEQMDDTLEENHIHSSITAETAQWIGIGTLLVATPIFAIRMRNPNKLGYKGVVSILSIGVGIMHVLLAPDHLADNLGIAYGIYFVIMGLTQIGFGLLFISKPTRRLAIIGIAGTLGSLFLYFITRIVDLPEPFGTLEEIDQVGILAKIVEVSMIVILTYLIVYLGKQMPVKLSK